MASRPRQSLLNLFDPLTLSSPTRDASSPSPSLDSGSDKENVNATTPKCSRVSTRSYDPNASETLFFKRTYSRSKPAQSKDASVSHALLGQSFEFDGDAGGDATNLCLVQLEDELDSACKYACDDLVERGDAPREPLSEILTFPAGSGGPTPCRAARNNKLVPIDTPSATPKSLLKFAAGVAKLDPSTPKLISPLASLQEARSRRSLSFPREINSPMITVSEHLSESELCSDSRSPLSPAPSLPFASLSPSLSISSPVLSPTTTSGSSSPPFQDPPLGLRSASFEIQSSFCMKNLNLSGDLLNDEMSFLARLDDESFSDFARETGSGGSAGSSPRTPADNARQSNEELKSPASLPVPEINKPESSRKEQDIVPPSRSGSPVSFASTSHFSSSPPSDSETETETEGEDAKPSQSEIQPRTPSSSTLFFGRSTLAPTLAPKKKLATLRTIPSELASSADNADKDKAKARFEAGISVSARPSLMRHRPSQSEIVPLTRTQPLAIKKKVGPVTAQRPAPTQAAPRTSIIPAPARASLSRRSSIGVDLTSSRTRAPDPTSGHSRLSASSSATIGVASAKGMSNSVASRPVGGARRVPITADAPLFQAKTSTAAPAPTDRRASLARSLSVPSKAGPQRPPAPASALASSMSAGGSAGRVAAVGSSASGPALSRTASFGGRASISAATKPMAAAVATSRSQGPTSRLPMPPSKATSRIPGPPPKRNF